MAFTDKFQNKKATVFALKKLLLDDSDHTKTQLLSLLQQLNIKSNSYLSKKLDNLSELYSYDEVDPYLHPPPDLQIYKTIQNNRNLSEEQVNSSNNNTKKSANWKAKQNRLRSNRHENQVETDNFHSRNIITVRQISCHDVIERQKMINNQWKQKQNKLKNEWKRKTKTSKLIDNNKLQIYESYPDSPFLLHRHTTSIKSAMNKSLISPSNTTIHTNILTTSNPTTLLKEQQECTEDTLDSMNTTRLKTTSLHNLPPASSASSHLLTTPYNQTKPHANILSTTSPDSKIDFGSSDDKSPTVLNSTSSIVPHFSSTIAPHVPYYTSSSTIVAKIPTPKIESSVTPTSKNENIQDLVDQLKTCIATLNEFFQNKRDDNKLTVPDIKSHFNDKESKTVKKKQSQSLASSISNLESSHKSFSNENNLLFEDIRVRRCVSFNDQKRKKYQSNMPPTYNDQLKRCLLVYYRNRERNLNSNERERNTKQVWNNLASNNHLLLSQSSQSSSNSSRHGLSNSQSTLILAEEDDEYEPLHQLSRVSSLLN